MHAYATKLKSGFLGGEHETNGLRVRELNPQQQATLHHEISKKPITIRVPSHFYKINFSLFFSQKGYKREQWGMDLCPSCVLGF